MMFGAMTSSQANGNFPYAEVSLSNSRPNPGDPIAVYLDLYDCQVFPTSISVNMYSSFYDLDPIVLDEKNSTFKVRKVGSVFKVRWLYRGPVGDGINNQRYEVEANATGGCITDPEDFREDSSWAEWIPTTTSYELLGVYSFFAAAEVNGLSLSWIPYGTNLSDETRFYEIQYAVAGTGLWSHSIITKDLSYRLQGLTKGTVYDLRIRARSNTGSGEWVENNWEARFRTPAAYEVTSFNADGKATRTFNAGETVKVKMKLSECSSQPSIQQSNGSLSYTLYSRTSPDFEVRNGMADSQGFPYDGVLQKYEGEIEFSNLPNGTYFMQSYLIGNCGWTWAVGGLPRGNDLEFTIGPKVPQVPLWGDVVMSSGVDVTAITATTATLAFSKPANLEDGPFVYTVEQLTSEGSVAKVLGTSKNYSFKVGGLIPGTKYEFRILVSNAVTTSPNMRPKSSIEVRTANVTVKRGSKLTAAAYAKAIGASVPSGATVSIAKPAGTFPFTDCKFSKNVVTFNNSVGACTVQLTIKPKKVGKTQPKSIVSQHDVIIKR